MERLKQMKERLIDCVENQINGCLEQASAEELGEAVDMIKDLDEAIYYGTLTKAMEDKKNENAYNAYYYTERIRPIEYPYERYELPPYCGDMMYYGGNGNNGGGRSGSSNSGRGGNNGGGMNYFQEGNEYMYGYKPVTMLPEYPMTQGRSENRRRMYMEGKHTNQDKAQQMKELEAYVQDLGQDITDMIQDASQEEKQLLQQKISMLASKIK